MQYKVVWFDSLPSTNTFCKEYKDRLPDGFVAVTQNQTNGKGSKGRNWIGSPGKLLAFSIAHRYLERIHLSALPLVVGITLFQTLEQMGISDLSLKWPNDLLLCRKKIAGILCESSLMAGKDFLVCGVGLNLLQTRQEFDEMTLPYAGSIYSETGTILHPLDILNILLEKYSENYTKWLKSGFAPFADLYRNYCETLGKEVVIIRNGNQLRGKALDVQPDGRLLCEADGCKRIFCAQEISLRTEDSYC